MSTRRTFGAGKLSAMAGLFLLGMPALAAAQDAPAEINGADTAWMLMSAALVLLMTPA
ncbi:MAG: ammonium transporter, partial [Acidobacteria bacterium]|nr:ammonium transporter [Acidobacteriota bacterium]